MELLTAKHSNEEPDARAQEGSSDAMILKSYIFTAVFAIKA